MHANRNMPCPATGPRVWRDAVRGVERGGDRVGGQCAASAVRYRTVRPINGPSRRRLSVCGAPHVRLFCLQLERTCVGPCRWPAFRSTLADGFISRFTTDHISPWTAAIAVDAGRARAVVFQDSNGAAGFAARDLLTN